MIWLKGETYFLNDLLLILRLISKQLLSYIAIQHSIIYHISCNSYIRVNN